MTPGRVVILDGTSSSGKTTLAKGLQQRLIAEGTCWVVTGVDDFFAKMPREWGALVCAGCKRGFGILGGPSK